MDIFNVVVGVFSIIGSIAGLISLGCLIKISISISNKGSNNTFNNKQQSNVGRENTNITIGRDNG